jgi:hypothetical protein
MNYKTDCLVCGAELKYLDDYTKMTCHFCEKEFESNVSCSRGHYICDECHSLTADEIIKKHCIESSLTDPIELATSLMKNPKVSMHGPEHHFLVPAVLLTAYYNLRNEPELKAEKLEQARKRASNVLGGFCGFHGACGAGIGTGIFISIITGANPLSKDEWKMSNLMTARSLLAISSLGGPRCCKRSSFVAIVEAMYFLDEHFGIVLPVKSDLVCEFSKLNRECLKEQCPFYNYLSRNES